MKLRLRRPPAMRASFEALVRDAFGFLVEEHGFEGPFAETYPHAEERISYERGPTLVDVRLGDGRIGVAVDVTTASGERERLGDERFQREDEPWQDGTRRVLHELANELARRADELLGSPDELARVARERFGYLEGELGFDQPRTTRERGVLELTWKHRVAGTAVRAAVQSTGSTEAWLGRLDRGGRPRPLDRDTIDRDWVLLAPPARLEQCARDVRSFGRKLLEPEAFFGG